MNEIVQWWKGVFVVMNHEEIEAKLSNWYVKDVRVES